MEPIVTLYHFDLPDQGLFKLIFNNRKLKTYGSLIMPSVVVLKIFKVIVPFFVMLSHASLFSFIQLSVLKFLIYEKRLETFASNPFYDSGGDEGSRTPVQKEPHIQASTV